MWAVASVRLYTAPGTARQADCWAGGWSALIPRAGRAKMMACAVVCAGGGWDRGQRPLGGVGAHGGVPKSMSGAWWVDETKDNAPLGTGGITTRRVGVTAKVVCRVRSRVISVTSHHDVIQFMKACIGGQLS